MGATFQRLDVEIVLLRPSSSSLHSWPMRLETAMPAVPTISPTYVNHACPRGVRAASSFYQLFGGASLRQSSPSPTYQYHSL